MGARTIWPASWTICPLVFFRDLRTSAIFAFVMRRACITRLEYSTMNKSSLWYVDQLTAHCVISFVYYFALHRMCLPASIVLEGACRGYTLNVCPTSGPHLQGILKDPAVRKARLSSDRYLTRAPHC